MCRSGNFRTRTSASSLRFSPFYSLPFPFPKYLSSYYNTIFFFYSLTLTLPLAHFKIDPFTFSPDLSFLLFFFFIIFFSFLASFFPLNLKYAFDSVAFLFNETRITFFLENYKKKKGKKNNRRATFRASTTRRRLCHASRDGYRRVCQSARCMNVSMYESMNVWMMNARIHVRRYVCIWYAFMYDKETIVQRRTGERTSINH